MIGQMVGTLLLVVWAAGYCLGRIRRVKSGPSRGCGHACTGCSARHVRQMVTLK